MCGIVGYVGKSKNTIPVLINGLEKLEYRGYDSSGIAYFLNDKIKIVKAVGKIENLKKNVEFSDETSIGIGHTRWATHGKPSTINSHPHQVENITLVHNGIIDNYKEMKEWLTSKGVIFKTETDTEVVAALINYFYKEEKVIEKAIFLAIKHLRGSYALGILVHNDDKTLYAIRKDSPLIIGHNSDENFIASDPLALSSLSNKIYYLEEGILAKITSKDVELYNNNLEKINFEWTILKDNAFEVNKDSFEHFMLKEIYEQPQVIYNTVNPYVINGLDSLIKEMPDFSKYKSIHIVACGSAYHTGCVGKKLIEEFAGIPVLVEIASEYRYNKVFLDSNTLVIVVSQSGETADTLAALKLAKEKCDTLAIVNVKNSSIAREAKEVICVKAGTEIAVATTKAYSAQVAIFSLIALNMAVKKGVISHDEAISYLEELEEIPRKLEELIKTCPYKEQAKDICYKNDLFFIGRGIDHCLCLEGSLKLKEISYLHSEAYSAGELKHGTISLIDEGTPVIAIVTDKNIADKTISNIEEVKSRGAFVILITTNDLDNSNLKYPHKIIIPRVSPIFQALFTIIPLQLIAYETARINGCDIDKPKNLAKSVTVE